MGRIFDEIVGPHVALVLRPQAQARAIVEPQSSPFDLLLGNLQTLLPPDALQTLPVHLPPASPKEIQDAGDAIAPVVAGELDDQGPQGRFVLANALGVALGGAGLPKHPTGSTLGHPVPRAGHRNGASAFARAQNFPDATSFKIAISSA